MTTAEHEFETTKATHLPLITTAPCSRCGGSGHFSYHLIHGTVCFGCGGIGQVPCAPAGQKKIPTTCPDVRQATVGDIVSVAMALYQVIEVTWTAVEWKGMDPSNQVVRLVRLVDGKIMRLRRAAYAPDIDGFLQGTNYCTIDGERKPVNQLVEPTPDMVGQDASEREPWSVVLHEEQELALIQTGLPDTGYHYELRMRSELCCGRLVYIPGFPKAYKSRPAARRVLATLVAAITVGAVAVRPEED